MRNLIGSVLIAVLLAQTAAPVLAQAADSQAFSEKTQQLAVNFNNSVHTPIRDLGAALDASVSDLATIEAFARRFEADSTITLSASDAAALRAASEAITGRFDLIGRRMQALSKSDPDVADAIRALVPSRDFSRSCGTYLTVLAALEGDARQAVLEELNHCAERSQQAVEALDLYIAEQTAIREVLDQKIRDMLGREDIDPDTLKNLQDRRDQTQKNIDDASDERDRQARNAFLTGLALMALGGLLMATGVGGKFGAYLMNSGFGMSTAALGKMLADGPPGSGDTGTSDTTDPGPVAPEAASEAAGRVADGPSEDTTMEAVRNRDNYEGEIVPSQDGGGIYLTTQDLGTETAVIYVYGGQDDKLLLTLDEAAVDGVQLVDIQFIERAQSIDAEAGVLVLLNATLADGPAILALRLEPLVAGRAALVQQATGTE